ncbi:MAG TPA: hypothetical protein VGB73_13495 [Pyrinomonadaceae bacterium]|jgi:hypothetical protein
MSKALNRNFSRHLLSLVLAVVLVWYTTVALPVSVPSTARRTSDLEPSDAEERGSHLPSHHREFKPKIAQALAAKPEADASTDGSEFESVDELDWPEIIGDEDDARRSSESEL